MDNELFKLCKGVYERTGWETPDWFDLDTEDGKPDEYLLTYEDVTIGRGGEIKQKTCPYYNSDYLLEKLPQFLNIEGYKCRLEIFPAGYGKEYKTPNYTPKHSHVAAWCAAYVDSKGTPPKLGSSDTPLKALLKLVISLSEAGELK